MVLARYQEVLRQPYVGRLLATAVVARLPQGMSGLAMILFLTPHLGYGRAGIATGVSVATAGLSNVVLARGVDRIGARRVLTPSAVLYAAAMLALAASGHSPYGIQLALCAAIGLVTPPITAVARGLWPRLLGAERSRVVYGLEATAQELIYICGPAAVALIAGLASAAAALVVSGVLGVIGTIAFVTAPPFDATAEATHGGAFHRPHVQVFRYAFVGVCLTVGLGMTDIATVDFVSGRRASAAAGVVLAVWSIGSLLGGLLFGAASNPVTDRTLSRAVLLTAVGFVAASAAPNAVGLAVLLFLGGAAVAPTLARLYTRMGTAAQAGSTTEAFGWLSVGFLIGSSLGSAVGGVSVDAIGPRWTFVLAGAAALCAIPVIAVRRPVASSRGR